jgi:hypothetical protein
MTETNNRVFLNKIAQRIKEGDFDKYLNFPFMTKELLYTRIKDRIEKKITTGGTPILTDTEVKECIEECRITAKETFVLFYKEGYIIRTENGYELTHNGEIAAKASFKI